MNVLVTGGAGFIGTHLVRTLLKTDNRVVVVDNLSNSKPPVEFLAHPQYTFIQGDVADEHFVASLFSQFEFKEIYHLAAVSSVNASVTDPWATHKSNFRPTLLLLEQARNIIGFKKFIFASSASVYGNPVQTPVDESNILNPMNPYALDKLSSEKYVVMYHKLFDLPTVALRFFNVYGEGQKLNSTYSGVISILCNVFLSKQQNINSDFILYGDGLQTRDFIHASDVVRAMRVVASSEHANGNVYNVGSGIEISLLELINLFERVTGETIHIVKMAARISDIKYSCANISRLRDLGFCPEIPIEQGLGRYWSGVQLLNNEVK